MVIAVPALLTRVRGGVNVKAPGVGVHAGRKWVELGELAPARAAGVVVAA